MRRWLPVLMALMLVMAMTVACGDDDDSDDDGGAAPTATTATTATQAATTPSGGAATATTGDEDNGDDEGDAAAGQQIAQAQCFTCHTIDGSTLVGPSWKGLYDHDVKLDDGSTVKADEDYIRESILEPNAKIVEGFPAAMPSFDGILDDTQIANIIAYIKTLE